MNQSQTRYYFKKLKQYLALKTGMVNHQEIIRDVVSGVEHSWIYYLMLLMAGLIALLGLLTNSVAVVIGAMLISPLMGPIISSGLALTIGDLALARRAFRTIAISVVLTILVTAFVTLLSPLKEPTTEILGRVRPNIYDLFVAMLSGIVGAIALCTKRNYLITATGVAVATAVIPPLSVAGYGLGTGKIMLGLGGFLLFFTNFVAIVLTSDLVFFIMGFRTSHSETIKYTQRTRLLIITTVLAVISIPLVYTLVVDIQKVKTKQRIERVLRKHLTSEDHSRMTGYTYHQLKNKLDIRATVNTVAYLEQPAEKNIEKELGELFGKPVDLHLEQVLVASDRLPETETAPPPRKQTPQEVSTDVAALAARVEQQLAAALAPFPVTAVMLSFPADNRQPLQVSATIHRDWPANSDELLLLGRQLEQLLELSLSVRLEIAPLLPPISVSDTGGLTAEAQKALALLTHLPGGPDAYRFQLRGDARGKTSPCRQVSQYLITTLQVPEKLISYSHAPKSRTVYLTVQRRSRTS